jgi:hypothetical protein
MNRRISQYKRAYITVYYKLTCPRPLVAVGAL